MDELAVFDIVKILWKKIWIIILSALIFASCAFGISQYLISPTYSTSSSLIVKSGMQDIENENASALLSGINVSQKLVSSYIVVLKSSTSLKQVAEISGVPYSIKEIKSMISIKAKEDSEVMEVTVKGKNRDENIAIANALLKVAPEVLTTIVGVGSVNTVDVAEENVKVSPNVTRNTIAGFALGFLIASAIILIIALMDQTVKSEEEIIERYKISVLGSVPDFNAPMKGGKYYGKYGKYGKYGN